MREAKRIAQGLAEVAELDRRLCKGGVIEHWNQTSLSRREALVAELGEICRLHPLLAVKSQRLFEELFERTRAIELQIRSERNQLALALQEAETNLKQLGAFGDRTPGDAKLVNRLA